jgi:hypothetical protein
MKECSDHTWRHKKHRTWHFHERRNYGINEKYDAYLSYATAGKEVEKNAEINGFYPEIVVPRQRRSATKATLKHTKKRKIALEQMLAFIPMASMLKIWLYGRCWNATVSSNSISNHY